MDKSLFELHDATVRRDGTVILHIDDLCIAEGESIALLGPNGSGKSTFVNLLTREVSPLYREEPSVLFRGSSRTELAKIKTQIGLVSSSKQYRITRHLPALHIVEGGLFGSLGTPQRITVSEQQEQRAYEVMDELGIAHLANRDTMTLSSGEARRVLIARALVHEPDIIVFDEPCTGLDPEGIYHVRNIMSTLIESGRTILLVTHYPEDIVREVERVILLKHGRIVSDAPKSTTLTSEKMTELFEVPITVTVHEEQYTISYEYRMTPSDQGSHEISSQ